MLKFFINTKFWLPLVLVIILAMLLELLLRFGYWDDYIKPQSYLGNAVYRKIAIEEFGLENIQWITIGDSRTDWGLEHDKIQNLQKKHDINHLRMSFESSNFMALQATIDWSIANMPNLKGIMLGISEDNIGHFSAVTKQYNVAWPFREYFDYDQYKYFDKNRYIYSFFARTAIAVYYKDLKQSFKHIFRRLNKIDSYLENKHNKVFKFNRNMTGDVCHIPLANLGQCVSSAKVISNMTTKLNGAERFILNVCHTSYANNLLENDLKNYKLSEQSKNDILINWQKLFLSILEKKVKLKVVLLPEHIVYDYIIKPTNTHELTQEIIDSTYKRTDLEILDLRGIFKNNNQCQFFQDPLHYNNHGKSIITQKIIESFSLTKIPTNQPKEDVISQRRFEKF